MAMCLIPFISRWQFFIFYFIFFFLVSPMGKFSMNLNTLLFFITFILLNKIISFFSLMYCSSYMKPKETAARLWYESEEYFCAGHGEK